MMVHALIWFYNACLCLYPRPFRLEFGDEMAAIFAQAAEEAAARGILALGRLCLVELAGIPVGLLRAHRLPARAATLPGRALDGSGRELVLSLAVFLLPAVMVQFSGEPQPGLPAASLFLGVMLLVGWLGGFPLWSLPYVGLVLVVASYLQLFQWVAGQVRPALIFNLPPGPWDPGASLLLEIASTGMVWLMLFCLTLLVVALLALFNRFQPLLARVRHDWTLLSYMLYGESTFALALLFRSYRTDFNYTVVSLLCLLAGVWFYLHSPSRRQRLLCLLAGLTLAMGVAVVERGPLALGSGPLLLSESGRLLLAWAGMAGAVLLPGLLARRPPSRGPGPLYL